MPAPVNEAELAEKASFVFKGTVQRLNAAKLPEIGDTSKTAIVRVDETLQSPKPLSHYTGQEITVWSETPLTEGEQGVFYTNAWLFGNSGPAVKSIGWVGAVESTAASLHPGADPVANLEARRAGQLYDSSDMVVTGTVSKVEMAGPRIAINTREHDPDWREATIHVSESHKNGLAGTDVVVRFPASPDRAWGHVPKLKAGDHGLFVLHKAGEGANYYVLKHVGDFEPCSDKGGVISSVSCPLAAGVGESPCGNPSRPCINRRSKIESALGLVTDGFDCESSFLRVASSAWDGQLELS